MRVITRSEWGAKPPKKPPVKMKLPAPEDFIHHSVTNLGTQSEIVHQRYLQAIAFARGFSDISYSFVFYPSGMVLEGRGWGIVGAHTEGHNSTAHGYAFVGNFQNEQPTQAALDACRWLISEGVRFGKIKPGVHPTGGHKDTPESNTACPGRNLYAKLDYLRRPFEPLPDERRIEPMIVEEWARVNEPAVFAEAWCKPKADGKPTYAVGVSAINEGADSTIEVFWRLDDGSGDSQKATVVAGDRFFFDLTDKVTQGASVAYHCHSGGPIKVALRHEPV